MNTVRLTTIVNAYTKHPEFNSQHLDDVEHLLDSVARKQFDSAAYALKSLTSGFGFYPDEHKAEEEFCKAIRVELMAVGKSHYHQEMANQIDFIMDSPHFNLFMPVLLPALSAERRVVLNSDKLDEAIKFYSERGEVFDLVIAGLLVQIGKLNKQMITYCEGH